MLKQEITDEDFILDKQPKKQLNSFFFFWGGGVTILKTEKVIHHRKAINPRNGNWILLYKNHFTMQQIFFRDNVKILL
jgi:hypothetical protein